MSYGLILLLLFIVAVLLVASSAHDARKKSRDHKAWLDYQIYAMKREQEEWDKQLAENRARYDECVRIEDEAWAEREQLVRRHVDKHGMFGLPLAFRRARAILFTGERPQAFAPDIPYDLERLRKEFGGEV